MGWEPACGQAVLLILLGGPGTTLRGPLQGAPSSFLLLSYPSPETLKEEKATSR